MWWDEARREWRKHPDCTCDRDPCLCPYLRPLDQFGIPMPYPIMDALRESLKVRTQERQLVGVTGDEDV